MPRGAKRKYADSVVHEWAAEYLVVRSLEAVSANFGIPRATVYSAFRRANVKMAKCGRKKQYAEDPTDPDGRRRRNIWSLYKITPDEYRALLEKQCGGCAICHRKSAERLHIDHDHATGKIRGLLCRNCNPGLGHFADSIERLENAISYLRNV